MDVRTFWCKTSDFSKFIVSAPGMRKRLNFCGSGSTLKKEAGSGSKLGSDQLYTELEGTNGEGVE